MSAESALVGHGAALKRFHAPLNGQSASGGYRPDQIDPSTGKLKDSANLN